MNWYGMPWGEGAATRRLVILTLFVAGVAFLGGAVTMALTDDAATAGASDDTQTLLVLASAASIATFAVVFYAMLTRPTDLTRSIIIRFRRSSTTSDPWSP